MALPRLRQTTNNLDERPLHPNHMIYQKMECFVREMMDPDHGLPIKTVKSFMSRIPSVFTGVDLIQWMMNRVQVQDLNESLHLAHMLACHGYLFPIDDHNLTVKNDGTFYRLQTPYFWPSNCWEPENTDYAVYLCKRTMQTKAHLELEDYEAENLAKLQRMYSRKWEFVFMQAEAQYKVDKKRERAERQILDSQERAFWDVHRPMPGCVNTTEVDLRKLSRATRQKPSISGIISGETMDGNAVAQSHHQRPGLRRCTLIKDILRQEVTQLKDRLSRNALKTSKVAESLMIYYTQRCVFDPFLCPMKPANPWVSDTVDFWSRDKITGEVSTRRMKQWGLSFDDLLSDTQGREVFQKFLDKEISGENLHFWCEVQKLRWCSSRMVPVLVTEIYNTFLGVEASEPVNIDSKVRDTTEENLRASNRWSFDEAAEHIYTLMKNDSYQRFLRSDFYKDFEQSSSKSKPTQTQVARGKFFERLGIETSNNQNN